MTFRCRKITLMQIVLVHRLVNGGAVFVMGGLLRIEGDDMVHVCQRQIE